MRNYCRAFRTSMDYLSKMPMYLLMDELEDAVFQLEEERREEERRAEKGNARAQSRGRRRR